MKRASSSPPGRAGSVTPEGSGGVTRTRGVAVAAVEQLRFRESDGTPSAYTRLYAQGVDLMVHKDTVYQQYGLHKSPTPGSGGSSTTRTAANWVKAATRSIDNPHKTRPQNSNGPAHPTPKTQTLVRSVNGVGDRKRSSSAVAPRKIPAGTSRTTRPMGGRPQTAGSKVTKATVSAPPKSTPKPQRRQSTIATQLLNKALKIGPAIVHPGSTRTQVNNPGSARSPRMSMAAPSGSNALSMTMTATTPQNRRQSFQIPLGRSQSRQSLSPTRQTDSSLQSQPQQSTSAMAQQPAVLVPVSRRTSSPIVAPNGGEVGGMRRRPSVSPIRSTQGANGNDDACGGQPHPMMPRRDSKMDRLVEQITVLKNSLGLSDEDLQWKVESTKGNAYLAADRHLNEAEERYDRLVYEIQLLTETPCDEASVVLVKRLKELVRQSHLVSELRPRLTASQNDVVLLKKNLMDARIATELTIAKTRGDMFNAASDETADIQQNLDAAKQNLLQNQERLKVEMSKLNELLMTLGQETDELAKSCADFKFMSPEAADVSITFVNILRCVPECSGDKLVQLCDQGVQMAQRLSGSRVKELKRKETELAKTMKDIEVWKARKEQSKEYGAELAKQERIWMESNREENVACLRLLRSLVPHDIQSINVEAIIDRAKALGVLYTYDLAIYLKQNRFLHWLVTHEADITRDNFLAIDSAPYFLNFTNYDISELRALCSILPDGFDFDKDGKKNGWKKNFLEHVRTLVKQQKGETIKAGWDPVKGTRADVQLKPLNEKQVLNTVYRYPTESEIKTRIDKFELQIKRLAQKREKLFKLEKEDIPTAKSEYHAIAEDARSEELLRMFGKASLIRLRDDAKQNFQSLCKTRDALKSEIEHSQKSWNAMCPSYEQYLDEVSKIRGLDPHTRSIRIRGPFPEEILLKPKERAAFKKLSVEEEAEARRQELSNAIAQRDKVISDGTNVSAKMPQIEDTVQPCQHQETCTTEPRNASDTQIGNPSPPQPKFEETEKPADGQGFRRVKSLRVSAEVLRFLQNDFCSPRRTKSNNSLAVADSRPSERDPANVPYRRPSLPKPEDKDAKLPPPGPMEPPRPKSKALLALLSNDTKTPRQPGEDDGAKPVPPLGFLSELKSKATKSSGSEPQQGASKPAFLMELQRRTNTCSGAADTVSGNIQPPPAPTAGFLDELKQYSQRKTKPIGSSNGSVTTFDSPMEIELPSSVAPGEPVRSQIHSESRPPALNFLDELKERAKASE